MKCVKCNSDIEEDDNFCGKCGEWTSRCYNYLKANPDLQKGKTTKIQNRCYALASIFSLGILIFVIMFLYQGRNIYKPFIYLKTEIQNLATGYKHTMIETNNKYLNENISNIEEARDRIKKDFSEQTWLCPRDNGVMEIENSLEEKYGIPRVVLCDESYNEATKIAEVFAKMNNLFTINYNLLTNVTIANTMVKDAYIAYFQPIYQFVNNDNDINSYNKVNKTQILLNSYYYLNDNLLSKNLNDVISNWYVLDATWESIIAHELGHYLTFNLYLKEKGISNIMLVTKDNEQELNNVIREYESGTFANSLVNKAINNYNNKYGRVVSKDDFAKSISNYAATTTDGKLNDFEIIAEAIHDYYLHENMAQKSSLEIVKVIKEGL